MSYWTLIYNLDMAGFAFVMAGAMILLGRLLRRQSGKRTIGWKAWSVLVVIVAVGCGLAKVSGDAEAKRLQRSVSGLAPTYAEEMVRLGLDKINAKTAEDDPTYLKLIDAQIRWLKSNPEVADIYTIGRKEDGSYCMLVDSETDYDHNGVIEGEREARTPIGDKYAEDQDELAEVMTGKTVFISTPTEDRWGTWINTYVPVMSADGKDVIGALGVDFDAHEYIRAILWHRGAMIGLAGLIGAVFMGSLSTFATLRGEMAKRDVLHKQLVAASREAGMAQIATGVLHNVGNALNSVNTTTAILAEKVDQGPAQEIAAALEMLKLRKTDLVEFLTRDDAGKHMPEYLAALGGAMREQQTQLRGDIKTLVQGVDHIKEIVRSQQQLARNSNVREIVEPASIVERAVTMVLGHELDGSGRLKVVREFTAKGLAELDEHKVLQILVNLLTNSVHAVRDVPAGRITLRIKPGGDGKLIFEVEDNGEGIASELQGRVFQHGFTTRPEGNGFGLHSCANSASEMQGSMSFYSDGRGKGARFSLEVPIGHGVSVAS